MISYFKNVFKEENKTLREILREDESFKEYLQVYSVESFNKTNTKLEFDKGLFF